MLLSQTQAITQDTLIPIGVTVAILFVLARLTWWFSAERESMKGQLAAQDKDIADIRKQLRYLTEAMLRVEQKLGTAKDGD